MSDFKELDLNLLNGYMESLGKGILEKMLALYIQQSVEYIDSIHKAADGGSQDLWQGSCHKMKGAAGSAGLLKVHAKLSSIEKSLENKEYKLNQIKELTVLNEQAITEFQSWISR